MSKLRSLPCSCGVLVIALVLGVVCLISAGLTFLGRLAFIHDTDPQGYETLIMNTLGIQGLPYESGTPSAIARFNITYWNGKEVEFWVPDDVLAASVAAGTEHGCDPWLLVAVAFSESPQYNNTGESSAGALGVWQFILSTWLGLWDSPPPPRTHIPSAADAACRYSRITTSQKQVSIASAITGSEEEFVRAFAIDPPVWNQHIGQARFVYKLTHELWDRDSGRAQPLPSLRPGYTMVWWRAALAGIFDILGLLPDSLRWVVTGEIPVANVANPDEFRMPYDDSYVITQGPHGQSYGHLAVDISAGKGAPILSPISGTVTSSSTDGLGNTVLVIENQRFKVTLMHGDFSAGTGVNIGDQVGTESNNGNTWTKDANGNPVYCGTGSNCGFHTHLNVFDKTCGCNVYPLDLIQP